MSKNNALKTRAGQGFYENTGAPPDILTASEAAALLRLHSKALRKLVNRGEIPAFRVTLGPKGHLRFRRSVLETWIRDREALMRRETEAV